jgi:hypothetical protein
VSNMPWVQRKSKRYYYRSFRERGRVRTVYVGTGEVAEHAAAEDRARRAARAAEQAGLRAARQSFDGVDGVIDRAARATDAIARANLMFTGFYRQERGRWRKRRHAD